MKESLTEEPSPFNGKKKLLIFGFWSSSVSKWEGSEISLLKTSILSLACGKHFQVPSCFPMTFYSWKSCPAIFMSLMLIEIPVRSEALSRSKQKVILITFSRLFFNKVVNPPSWIWSCVEISNPVSSVMLNLFN